MSGDSDAGHASKPCSHHTSAIPSKIIASSNDSTPPSSSTKTIGKDNDNNKSSEEDMSIDYHASKACSHHISTIPSETAASSPDVILLDDQADSEDGNCVIAELVSPDHAVLDKTSQPKITHVVDTNAQKATASCHPKDQVNNVSCTSLSKAKARAMKPTPKAATSRSRPLQQITNMSGKSVSKANVVAGKVFRPLPRCRPPQNLYQRTNLPGKSFSDTKVEAARVQKEAAPKGLKTLNQGKSFSNPKVRA